MSTTSSPAFGSMGNTQSTTTNQGTGNPSYTPTQDKESGALISSMSLFHSISAMPAYKNWSYEELRLADYGLNKKHAGAATGGGFGASAFGSTMQAPSAFGATGAPQSNAFGSMGTTTGFGGFGASTTTAFGSQAQVTQAGSVFGAPTSTPAFGAPAGAFGQPQAAPFGQKPASSTTWGNLFLFINRSPACWLNFWCYSCFWNSARACSSNFIVGYDLKYVITNRSSCCFDRVWYSDYHGTKCFWTASTACRWDVWCQTCLFCWIFFRTDHYHCADSIYWLIWGIYCCSSFWCYSATCSSWWSLWSDCC